MITVKGSQLLLLKQTDSLVQTAQRVNKLICRGSVHNDRSTRESVSYASSLPKQPLALQELPNIKHDLSTRKPPPDPSSSLAFSLEFLWQ